jgi:hypothetical protein
MPNCIDGLSLGLPLFNRCAKNFRTIGAIFEDAKDFCTGLAGTKMAALHLGDIAVSIHDSCYF